MKNRDWFRAGYYFTCGAMTAYSVNAIMNQLVINQHKKLAHKQAVRLLEEEINTTTRKEN